MASITFSDILEWFSKSRDKTFTEDEFSHCSLTSSNFSLFLADNSKEAPCFDNSIANAFPIPDEAPVIQTTLFVKFMLIVLQQCTYFKLESVILVRFLKNLQEKNSIA